MSLVKIYKYNIKTMTIIMILSPLSFHIPLTKIFMEKLLLSDDTNEELNCGKNHQTETAIARKATEVVYL